MGSPSQPRLTLDVYRTCRLIKSLLATQLGSSKMFHATRMRRTQAVPRLRLQETRQQGCIEPAMYLSHARSKSEEPAHERKAVASWTAGPSIATSVDGMPTCSVLMMDGCWAISFQLHDRATFILMPPNPKKIQFDHSLISHITNLLPPPRPQERNEQMKAKQKRSEPVRHTAAPSQHSRPKPEH